MNCGFRLKKDLPFAMAGETIDEIRSSRGTNELSSIRIGNCECNVSDNENIFDWIEEIKPREWCINEEILNRNNMNLISYEIPKGVKYIKVKEEL